jgi:putative transposase
VDSYTYHVMSRFVKEVPFMDHIEREGLRKLIGKMAEFMGIAVLTCCVMSNQFHALIEVPNWERWLEF